MKIDILSLFPEMFSAFNTSILKRATNNNLIEINVHNIRDFSKDSHKKCDDTTYGGGEGMLMTCQPIYDAVMNFKNDKSIVVYMSPRGKVFNNETAKKYASKYEHIIIICGHYEGIDERIIDLVVDDEISIGDYILTGGEIPAMVFVDCVCRFVDGVLGNDKSAHFDSFENNLLEYPQYTKPYDFMGKKVPDVLISGNHKEIEIWRKNKSLEITKKFRPDLKGVNNEN